jgi:hypothetical protein
MQDQNAKTDQNETVHPFERTLGQGPYTFVGAGRIAISETFGARYIGPECERGAGTCAHCGHAIMNIFVIRIGDGRQFGVGSDCIFKASIPARELSKVKRAELQRQREMRQARKAKKGLAARTELRQLLVSHSEILQKTPFNERQSMFQYATWCVDHSNDGGIVFALKRVKAAL